MMRRIVLLAGVMVALLVQGLALGERGWKGDGVVICDGYFDGGVWPLAIVKDGRGGAIIAWNDSRGPDESIYAQRVDSTGQVLWPEHGVCLRSPRGRVGRDICSIWIMVLEQTQPPVFDLTIFAG